MARREQGQERAGAARSVAHTKEKPPIRGIGGSLLYVSHTQSRKAMYGTNLDLERETGFEPATSTLARLHSTTELFPLVGAGLAVRRGGFIGKAAPLVKIILRFFAFSFYVSIFAMLLVAKMPVVWLAGAELMIKQRRLRYGAVLARNRAYSKLNAEYPEIGCFAMFYLILSVC